MGSREILGEFEVSLRAWSGLDDTDELGYREQVVFLVGKSLNVWNGSSQWHMHQLRMHVTLRCCVYAL